MSQPSSKHFSLVLDAGTTGLKAFVFDSDEKVIAKANQPLAKHFPQPGWVEQDPQEMVIKARQVLREVLQLSQIAAEDIRGLGMTNQRETVIAWDTQTGEAIYPAIGWQDKRLTDWCKQQIATSFELVREKTGLPIDPYFSATKIAWILENVAKAQDLITQDRLAVGTIDSWLLWNLVEGSPHLTDYTNASRTLLFNIKKLRWDEDLLSVFKVPNTILPTVQPSVSRYGVLQKNILDHELPVLAVTGDQQASLYAAGSAPGTTKITYGTGTFIMQVVGSDLVLQAPFFTTLAVNPQQQPWYALEAKTTSGVDNVTEILQNPSLLTAHLHRLVQSTVPFILALPYQPSEIVIDGGWIRDSKILSVQSAVSTTAIREQKIFDGTALGMHRLIQSQRG